MTVGLLTNSNRKLDIESTGMSYLGPGNDWLFHNYIPPSKQRKDSVNHWGMKGRIGQSSNKASLKSVIKKKKKHTHKKNLAEGRRFMSNENRFHFLKQFCLFWFVHFSSCGATSSHCYFNSYFLDFFSCVFQSNQLICVEFLCKLHTCKYFQS